MAQILLIDKLACAHCKHESVVHLHFRGIVLNLIDCSNNLFIIGRFHVHKERQAF